MTTIEKPENPNYAAVVLKLGETHKLEGLDNLVGATVLGLQALIDTTHQPGETMVAFTAETQLSEEFAYENNLNRDVDLNKDATADPGYLDKNRRVRAIRLRKHASHALIMPLSALAYTGANLDDLEPGMQFDKLNGHDICKKYEVYRKPSQAPGAGKLKRAFKRVDEKMFPEHLKTSQLWRAYDDFRKDTGEIVITQKLHGTLLRVGRVPVRREKGRVERFLNRWISTPDYEIDNVYGSNHVIKDANNPNQNHFYKTDIWTEFGKTLDEKIPDGVIVYGELIGWLPDGKPIQKGYTYDLPQGRAEFYVYRVATINASGFMVDLSWDGVKTFCSERGLKRVPEYLRIPATVLKNRPAIEEIVDQYLDLNHAKDRRENMIEGLFREVPVPLSAAKSVDEGICLRQEGVVPTILKLKAPKFFDHETKVLDEEAKKAAAGEDTTDLGLIDEEITT